MQFEGCIEKRVDDGYCTVELLQRENNRFREGCEKNHLPYVLIDDDYIKSLDSISF